MVSAFAIAPDFTPICNSKATVASLTESSSAQWQQAPLALCRMSPHRYDAHKMPQLHQAVTSPQVPSVSTTVVWQMLPVRWQAEDNVGSNMQLLHADPKRLSILPYKPFMPGPERWPQPALHRRSIAGGLTCTVVWLLAGSKLRSCSLYISRDSTLRQGKSRQLMPSAQCRDFEPVIRRKLDCRHNILWRISGHDKPA